MPARQRGGEFLTQQMSIGSGDDQISALAVEAMNKLFPAIKVLDLVKKPKFRVRIDALQCGHDVIARRVYGKAFILEI